MVWFVRVEYIELHRTLTCWCALLTYMKRISEANLKLVSIINYNFRIREFKLSRLLDQNVGEEQCGSVLRHLTHNLKSESSNPSNGFTA
jgi:hypothetical protein